MTEQKIDLFKELIPLLDTGNINLINELEDEVIRKEISPLMALKIMSAVFGKNEEYAILATNEVVNKGFWHMTDHPKLQLMLLALCSTKKLNNNKGYIRHYFPGKKQKSKIFEQIRKWYPTWKDDEITMFINFTSKDELIQIAQDFGMQDKELKKWSESL